MQEVPTSKEFPATPEDNMTGDQLQAKFQRLSIWLGGLAGMAAFLLFLLCRRAPVEGITFLESLAVGAAAGLVVGLAIRMAGCMVFEYRGVWDFGNGLYRLPLSQQSLCSYTVSGRLATGSGSPVVRCLERWLAHLCW